MAAMINGGGGIKNGDEESFDSNKQILLIEENDDDHHRRCVQQQQQQLISNNNNNNDKGKGKGKGEGGGIISIAERRAAKCGFNASSITADRWVRPAGLNRSQPYFTVPPGISPSALLDSPVMLPNVQAQLSPTTGTFQFPSPNHENESLRHNLKQLGSNGEDETTMSMESSSSLSALRVDNNNMQAALEEFCDLQGMRKMEECFHEDKIGDDDQVLGGGGGGKKLSGEVECLASKNTTMVVSSTTTSGIINNLNNNLNNNKSSGSGNSSISNGSSSSSKEVGGGGCYKYSEDGFLWRKYGQKHVKGSEYPRSYYKCTNSNCVVRKKVERSHDGQITEIVYRGSHNHPKPPPHNFKRSSSSDQMMMMTDTSTTTTTQLQAGWRSPPPPPPTTLLNDFPPLSNTSSLVDLSSTFQASPDTISFNDDADDDDHDDQCDHEPKKRKRGDSSSSSSIPNETAVARSTREPKVVVQIESEIDILDDGYRWRKYGQKVVKGNPNPRSYYKCTTPGCPVRKHVERAANDIKSVITTYEGKHNHQVPTTKTPGTAGLVIHSDHHHHVPNHNNNNNNNNNNATAVVTSTIKSEQKLGRQMVLQEQLPMFMDRKPILSTYNELMMMRSNHQQLPPAAAAAAANFNFGTCTSSSTSSSPYPVSFPPFNPLPYSSLLMNNNRIKTIYPFSNKTYPTVSDYVNHVLLAGSTNNNHHVTNTTTTTLPPPTVAPPPPPNNNNNNFHYNNSSTTTTTNSYNIPPPPPPAAPLIVQTSSSTPGHEMIDNCHLVVKPKEEQRDDQVFDNCLPLPNHGNGPI